MRTPRQNLGAAGEQQACDFLTGRGMQILERNWRGGHTEIDIIALDGQGVHFVEVKTRVAPVMAAPEENVRAGKQKTLVKAAQAFLHSPDREAISESEVFFDVVSVVFDGETAEVQFVPQAFIPMYF